MSEGYDVLLVQRAGKQVGDSADDQAIHHEGDGEGSEFCGNLSAHGSLLVVAIEVFR